MQPVKQKIVKLRRKQLDQLYDALAPVVKQLPSGAWIKDVRMALGMSAAQMARCLGISKPTLTRMEHSEASQSIELKTLQRIAAVMNCKVVYAIVPEPGFGSLEDILHDRARQVATKLVNQVSHTMALEDQAIAATERASQIDELVAELTNKLDKRLWGAD